MSNEVNDVTPEELNLQLRHYGQWLEQRSDVALSPVDVAVVPDGGDDPDDGPPVGRLLAIAVAGAALLALAAIGMGALGDTSEADNVATAAADGGGGTDTPTSDVADPPAAATERPDVADAAPGAGAEAAEEAGDADDEMTQSTTETDADGDQDGQTDADAGSDGALVAEPEVFNDEALTPSTFVLEEGQTSIAPNEGGGATAPGFLFIAPRDGQAMSLNASHTIEARLVAGAANYTFEAWQNGAKVLDFSSTERTFLMPNQMLTGNPSMAPGELVLRVTASDASGSVMARGEITVTMQGAASAAPSVTTGPWPTNG